MPGSCSRIENTLDTRALLKGLGERLSHFTYLYFFMWVCNTAGIHIPIPLLATFLPWSRLKFEIFFCDASPWFARSPDSSVGSSFTLSRKSGWNKWNKHYCVQIIRSCHISWGRMGPLRLRGGQRFSIYYSWQANEANPPRLPWQISETVFDFYHNIHENDITVCSLGTNIGLNPT